MNSHPPLVSDPFVWGALSGRFSLVRARVCALWFICREEHVCCSAICCVVIHSQVTSHPVIDFGLSECQATLIAINPLFLGSCCWLVWGCSATLLTACFELNGVTWLKEPEEKPQQTPKQTSPNENHTLQRNTGLEGEA